MDQMLRPSGWQEPALGFRQSRRAVLLGPLRRLTTERLPRLRTEAKAHPALDQSCSHLTLFHARSLASCIARAVNLGV